MTNHELHTFEVGEDRIGKDIKLFFGGNAMTHKAYINNGYVGKVKWNMAMLLLIGRQKMLKIKF